MDTSLHSTRRTRRTLRTTIIFVFALLALIITPFVSAQAIANSTSTPDVMATVGDSITDRPDDSQSWAIGTLASVNSVQTRIETATGTDVTTIQHAKAGADSSAIVSQMTAAAATDADFITVLMGANDVCGNNLSEMTSIETFRARYAAALDIAENANKKVVAVSIPSLYALWNTGKESLRARTVWDYYNICQVALHNPTSYAQADVDRRQAVKDRNEAFNAIIKDECAKHTGCAHDGGLGYTTPLLLSDLEFDYFHPNVNGQAKIAAAAWPAVTQLYPNLGGSVTPTPTTPTPTTPTPTTPAPTAPAPQPGTTTSTSRTVKLNSHINRDIGVRKVELTLNSRIITVDVTYQGAGIYYATVNKTRAEVKSGTYRVSVKAYKADGTMIYKGPISITVK